ncbi:MAG TPA: hypothetical protein PLT64_04560 [Syntrophales bacterium]|nr:hypothetical protein [Syntrophales bacterium]HOL59124.1 hypothetical protein [Syntrophales bacterium]HPO36069.1 hypothetical protein [Syntrophales bacterium]
MRWVIGVLLATLALSATALTGISDERDSFTLQISDHLDGQVYFSVPVKVGSRVKLQFLHSYDRLPFWELYEVCPNGRFMLLKIGGKSLLNGQGFIYSGYRHLPDGTWEIGEINEAKDTICFFMGTIGDADHEVTLSEKTIKLSQRIRPGRIVRLSLTGGKEPSHGGKSVFQ